MREPCIFRAQTARSSGHLRKLLCQFEIDLLSHACRVEPRGGDVLEREPDPVGDNPGRLDGSAVGKVQDAEHDRLPGERAQGREIEA